MVFLLDWWAAALIGPVLQVAGTPNAAILAVLPFEGALRIAVFAAIFAIWLARCFCICAKGIKTLSQASCL